MTVKALYDYDFPSADRQELFGADQLVYVHWKGNPLFSSAACFRVPRDMAFGAFVETMVHGWAGSDPDFVPSTVHDWQLFQRPLDPADDRTLSELGIGHKALLTFST